MRGITSEDDAVVEAPLDWRCGCRTGTASGCCTSPASSVVLLLSSRSTVLPQSVVGALPTLLTLLSIPSLTRDLDDDFLNTDLIFPFSLLLDFFLTKSFLVSLLVTVGESSGVQVATDERSSFVSSAMLSPAGTDASTDDDNGAVAISAVSSPPATISAMLSARLWAKLLPIRLKSPPRLLLVPVVPPFVFLFFIFLGLPNAARDAPRLASSSNAISSPIAATSVISKDGED
mmetsp:Transcript_5272/g.11119  ORF Transcript_5272/g.11119 Transcript_5272/m.11119 type:complete len:232 (+) Transcript_5272:1188-1883(+)